MASPDPIRDPQGYQQHLLGLLGDDDPAEVQAATPSAIRRLIELIKRVLPDAREVDLYWAYHNLSGALTLTLGETGRLDRLSGGLCRSGDLETAGDYMVRFAAAGFRAVCGPRPV